MFPIKIIKLKDADYQAHTLVFQPTCDCLLSDICLLKKNLPLESLSSRPIQRLIRCTYWGGNTNEKLIPAMPQYSTYSIGFEELVSEGNVVGWRLPPISLKKGETVQLFSNNWETVSLIGLDGIALYMSDNPFGAAPIFEKEEPQELYLHYTNQNEPQTDFWKNA